MDGDKMRTFTYNDMDVPAVAVILATIVTEILDGNHKFLGIL